ncbi:MAG: tyrosine-type recombinase/integrase [Muribaculaceae bacterium]|nr:tyrosine-type recombinase/integrase [Muribaculaceae bacterium]
MFTQPNVPIVPIPGLLEGYESALTEMGYSMTTKLLFIRRADLIIRRHMDKGLECLDRDTIRAYTREIDGKYYNGGMQRRHYERTRREIDRFAAYAFSGRRNLLPSPLRGVRQKLSPEFEGIVAEFLSGDFHPNTRCDMRWAATKYFAWLESQGFKKLDGVGTAQIQKFLLDCSEKYAPCTIHDLQLYLKKLYAFLHTSGRAEEDFRELLSFTVNRDKKVYPPLPKSDIAKLLDTIDRAGVTGKRDYAVMMLGTVLGLRACDIVSLKLKDIDWVRGEIRIVQSKTSTPVALPLTQDVGEALRDYILNARPESAAGQVFLRINAPHTPLAAAVTVGEIYAKCSAAAGLPVNKRFHDLRRSLGTSMASNGVPVHDVAQVLGHRNDESVKPYIATDMEHLKMCSLPFAGIAPKGGGAV